MVRQPGKGGTETDYLSSRIYAARLSGPMMRGLLQVSPDCCEDFGTLSCLDCILEKIIPDIVPACGASTCTTCHARSHWPCGNEDFRDRALEQIEGETPLIGG